MTNNHIIRSQPVLVGIDIAKNRHEVLIEVSNKKRGTLREISACMPVLIGAYGLT